jgi:hypothetical protein
MRVEKTLETDLGVIQENCRKQPAGRRFRMRIRFFPGGLRLEARRAQRSGMSVHIGLITVALREAACRLWGF